MKLPRVFGSGDGQGPRLSGWAARTPLRIKLVAALIGLLVLGLGVTGVTVWATLRNDLLAQVDSNLISAASSLHLGQDELNNPGAQHCAPDTGPGGSPYAFAWFNDNGAVSCAATDGTGVSLPAYPHLSTAQVQARNGTAFTVGSVHGDQQWRVVGGVAPPDTVVFVAISLAPVEHTLNQLVLIELLGGLVAVAILGGLGYALVRRSLRPLVEVEEAAGDIAAGDLSRRVPDRDQRTEVGRLSLAFNTMLSRIESAFQDRAESEKAARASEERMRRFVADASHELRTPLTSIRGFAELYRQGAVPDPADISRVMRRIEDQATRMGLLVEDLLLLARLDQQRPLDRKPVDLLTIASAAVQDARALDPARRVALTFPDGQPPPLVLGDETRLLQVVSNLMSNAITHTDPGTDVTVSVRTEDNVGVLDVADRGPGMSEEDAAHVFERFYRADASRARSSGGTGLGLSIAAALVAAHSGTLSVVTAPGQGATFSLRVPLVPVHSGDPEPVSPVVQARTQ